MYGIHFCFLALVRCVVILCFLNHLRYDLLEPSSVTSWQINGETMETVTWTPKSLQIVIAVRKLKDTCSLKKSYDQPREHIKKQRYYFANKGRYIQSYGFSSSHVWMEKVMAPHSSTLAWKIPWTEEPGRLQSMESRRV